MSLVATVVFAAPPADAATPNAASVAAHGMVNAAPSDVFDCYGDERAEKLWSEDGETRWRFYATSCTQQELADAMNRQSMVTDIVCSHTIGLLPLFGDAFCAGVSLQEWDLELANRVCGDNDLGVIYEATVPDLTGNDRTVFFRNIELVGCQKVPYFYQNIMYENGRCNTLRFDVQFDFVNQSGALLPDTMTDIGVCQIAAPRPNQLEDATADTDWPWNEGDEYLVQSYTNWFTPAKIQEVSPRSQDPYIGLLSEAMWVSGHGFMRVTEMAGSFIPRITGDWVYIGSNEDPEINKILGYQAGGQGGVMIGRDFHQMVFDDSPQGNCHRYEGEYSGTQPKADDPNSIDPLRPLNLDTVEGPVGTFYLVDFGCDAAPTGCHYSLRPWEPLWVCPTDDAGNLRPVTTYTAWQIGQTYSEGLWRGTVGYVRTRDVDANGSVDFASGSWDACCRAEEGEGPVGQGGYIIWEDFDPSQVEAAQVSAGPAECDGRPVTVYLALGQSPTNGDDVIMGTPGDDTVRALFGNDVICGQGGNDTLSGNQGNDRIFGGPGNDTLLGGYDDDVVFGEAGDDRISNNRGNDTMRGGPGNDHITGGIHSDTIYGEDGDDALGGNQGDDAVWGGHGADRLWGNDGNDTVGGNQGNDRIWGGNGNDTLYGGYDDDVVFGEAGDDRISNNRGNDTMNGGAGADTCTRGNGTDTLISC